MSTEAYESVNGVAEAIRDAASGLFNIEKGAKIPWSAVDGMKTAMERAQQDGEGNIWIESQAGAADDSDLAF
jgi:hypothetical protein